MFQKDNQLINEIDLKNQQEELTESGNKAGVLAEDYGENLKDPFDPKLISISKKTISLDQVIRRIKTGKLKLAPAFQRNEVWNITKKSQLIESLMLNIPIPLFYVAEDSDGNWDVVDGLQRLSAIKEFLIDKSLSFTNLEFFTSYNGKKIDSEEFSDILYNRIFETEFSFVIIGDGTPEAVKYNIFKRINTGGVLLSPQEIRHALYQGASTSILKELSENESFKLATDNSINDSRMAAREIILRCISFMLIGTSGYAYNDNMETFLQRGIQILNFLETPDILITKNIYTKETLPDFKIKSYKELIRLFELSMQRNFELFGTNSFRFSKSGKRRTAINKALFDSWGSILAFLENDKYEKLKTRKEKLIELYDKKKDDSAFYDAISRRAWQKQNVDKRFSDIKEIIQEVIR